MAMARVNRPTFKGIGKFTFRGYISDSFGILHVKVFHYFDTASINDIYHNSFFQADFYLKNDCTKSLARQVSSVVPGTWTMFLSYFGLWDDPYV